MNKINLRPCLFCGGEAEFILLGSVKCKYDVIRCKVCFCMTDALKNKVEGSKKWNVRTIQLDDYIPATSVQKLKNERGAGRKPSDLRYAKQAVMLYREDGYSMRKIAKIYGVSVGTVHKLINEQNKTG